MSSAESFCHLLRKGVPMISRILEPLIICWSLTTRGIQEAPFQERIEAVRTLVILGTTAGIGLPTAFFLPTTLQSISDDCEDKSSLEGRVKPLDLESEGMESSSPNECFQTLVPLIQLFVSLPFGATLGALAGAHTGRILCLAPPPLEAV